jgi:tetratricopeptide (TPR) repeat protein
MPDKNRAPKKLTRREQRDLDVEIQFMEGIIRRDPGYTQALQVLGEDYTRRGNIREGLKVDEQLSRLQPGDAYVHYNLACSYSLAGQLAEAAAVLEKALRLGFREFKWLAKDPDLHNLRQHPLYETVQAKIKQLKVRTA